MEVEDFPDLMVVKELQRALKAADEEWIASFRDSGGMEGICKVRFSTAVTNYTTRKATDIFIYMLISALADPFIAFGLHAVPFLVAL